MRRLAAFLVDSGVFCAIAGVSYLLVIILPVSDAFFVVTTLALLVFFSSVSYLPIAYFIYLNGRGGRGQTLGKRLLRIRVRAAARDRPLGYGAAALRFGCIAVLAAFAVSWYPTAQLAPLAVAPFVLDQLWSFWDRRRQCLHDKIARSVVVAK